MDKLMISRKRHANLIPLFLGLCLLISACLPTIPTETASVTPESGPDLYLNIIWHQHQPFYAVDQETNLVSAPWVRFHAAKDYVDMVTILANYPNIHVTFNLTPSLISQLDSLIAGQRDIVWYLTMIPADELTSDQKTYILQRFFDTNSQIMDRFPRYKELFEMREGVSQEQILSALSTWEDQDFLDLQVLFNLAWTDPDYLLQEPLSALVEKGRDYSEGDKPTILAVHADLISQVIPVHKQYQDTEQIEVTFTPYAHPILPLLIDTNLALEALPELELPSIRYTHGDDAIQHLERGIALYQEKFDQLPHGMWPAEGSVAQYMVGMTARAGVLWMVTDEGILSKSLDLDFSRDSEGVPVDADSLYRPYQVASGDDAVTIFFRDTDLSNKVSFDYSQITASEAVTDFISRIHALRDFLKDQPGGPYVVTVILDGENAWEWYENDGKEFLNGIYSALSSDSSIKTVTPTEYLSLVTPDLEVIPSLWAGSWDSASFQTWIGEEEENNAWDYLGATRMVLEDYLTGSSAGSLPEAQVENAYIAMLAAEGSDWFWWFGSDKDSGNDTAFDLSFRETLGQVFDHLGLARPDFLKIPIIQPRPIAPDISPEGVMTATIDGNLTTTEEWASAGEYTFNEQPLVMKFGFDKDNLFINLLGSLQETTVLYLKVPALKGGEPMSEDGQILGFYATHRLMIQPSNTEQPILFDAWVDSAWQTIVDSDYRYQGGADNYEISIPLTDLQPTLDNGDNIQFRLVTDTEMLPAPAPGQMLVPDLGRTTWILSVDDPSGDDHGPGTYTYPTDGVFKSGVFDLLRFQVGFDETNLVFQFIMRGPVDNPWGAPNGLSLQLFDVYINTGLGENQLMRFGRNASLDIGWDYALTIAGWNYGMTAGTDPEHILSGVPLTIITDPSKDMVLAKIPLTAIPGDPQTWSYAVVVLSNDGYGINGVRDVGGTSSQWTLGGAPDDTNHTRVIDYLWPDGLLPSQEDMLSDYPPSTSDPKALTASDFPELKMLTLSP